MTLDNLLSGVIGGIVGGACSVAAVVLQNHLKAREDQKDRELRANLLSVIVFRKMMELIAELNGKRTLLEWDKKRDEIPFEKYNPATIAERLKIEIPEFLDDAVKNAHVWGAKDGAELAQILWFLGEYNKHCDGFVKIFLNTSLDTRLPVIEVIEQTSLTIVEMIGRLLPSIEKRVKQVTG